MCVDCAEHLVAETRAQLQKLEDEQDLQSMAERMGEETLHWGAVKAQMERRWASKRGQ